VARGRRRHAPSEISANLTPMIDVTFLLIVFFALVSEIAGEEQVAMALARVAPGVAVRADDDARAVLNVLPVDGGGCAGYALGARVFAPDADGVAALAETLAARYRAQPRLSVRLRADRGTNYEWVEPAMRAATTAARLAGGGALPRLDLAVEEDARSAPRPQEAPDGA
jgi:biopolymer transport protein ExbD